MIPRRAALTTLPLAAAASTLWPSKALASTYTDVPSNHPFHKEITWATSHKYIPTPFNPEGTIDRKTLATTFYTYWGKPSYRPPATPYFKDVSVGHPHYKEISWCVRKNLMNGWADKTFRPDEKVNREAAAAFFYRLAGSPQYTPPAVSQFTDVPINNIFYKEICWLKDIGITQGYLDGTYHPYAHIERAAVCAFLYRINQILG